MTTNFEEIEIKHKKIIDIAKEYMATINDYEHNLEHALDVVCFCKELLTKIDTKDVDLDCILISCYWHDVGRTKCQEGHELISAQMLKQELINNGYDKSFADKCFECVETHNYSMIAKTIEGHILKDSDKLAFLGLGRWRECLDNNQNLDDIVALLPRLKNELLHFEESKEIYDRQILKIFNLLYKRIYK